MTALKKLLIVTAFLAGGPSLAMAQNGLPTGAYPPVMGGAGGNPAVPGSAFFPEGRFAPGYGYGYQPYRGLYGYYRPSRHYNIHTPPNH